MISHALLYSLMLNYHNSHLLNTQNISINSISNPLKTIKIKPPMSSKMLDQQQQLCVGIIKSKYRYYIN